jgi:hypothetical protein
VTGVPLEYRAIGVTTDEWVHEAIVEAIEAMSGAFRASSLPDIPDRLRTSLRVLDEMVAAGLLRELDTRNGSWYVRTDVPCAMREPEMRIYRCYDATGRLLYIGSTSRLVADRIANHAKTKAWWPEVVRITEETVHGWTAGRLVEREAIIAERPLRNVAHNRRSA